MLKYRGSSLIRAGFIGLVLILLVITVGLAPQKLISWATSIKHQAVFSEAGGLVPGNDVKVSGVKVGTVSDVSLQRGKALVTFLVNGGVHLGTDTTAHIRTGTLLGQRVLTLESDGKGTLKAADVIPVSRTGSPYSLTQSLSDFTANTADTDTAALNQSLNTLSDTIDRISPQLGPTFDGVSRLSRMLNERNDSLASLLKSAADVTGILGAAQPAGERPAAQRQRPARRPRPAPLRDRRICWPTPPRCRGSCPGSSPTTRRIWRRRWRSSTA